MDLPTTRADTPILDRTQPIPPIAVHDSTTASTTAALDESTAGVNLHAGNAVKRKRGRPPKAQMNQPAAKKSRDEDEEEDVCFICFDGGSLVLCDRRGCPKAYHPSCIKRDEAFFRSKAKWNCGWHICSICEKTAHHMCYTCTHSLCKGCIRQSDYVCVRGDKGFCALCMKTIMLIENSRDATANVDFDDKTSWEYLFKVYWVYLKGKLSLTLDELTRAKNPWKVASIELPVSHISTTVRRSITSELSLANLEANESKRRKTNEQPIGPGLSNGPSMDEPKEWASKELLDLVAHMKNGDTSVLSQSDVQALLLDYIKINNLRDPRKKTQIICDLRLMNLFGKPRVGHIEMLKLLESQFYVKKNPEKNTTDSTVKPEDTDYKTKNTMTVPNKERRNHMKGEKRITQNKLDEYAAIDVHNMNLIYLRRNLMESLIENIETFREKLVGSIVQIRISGSDQKDDMYRLVQVVGTMKVDVPYKVGDKLVDVMLEVLNLDKKETVSIDTISNQELSEGEIQEKAMALQSMLLDDRIKTEMQRLNQLRDQASEKGQKKSVRECVQKLKILKTPEERERRLREIPEIHSDPKMNPDYESDDTEEYFNNEHGEHLKLKFPWVSGKNTISPATKADNLTNQPGNSGVANVVDANAVDANVVNANVIEESSKPNTGQDVIGLSGSVAMQNEAEQSTDPKCNPEAATSSPPSKVLSELKPNRSVDDDVWHYRDPSGNVQGPFSMVQLQKWNTSGYFPADMRVWADREADSVLLNDVLHEQFNSFDVWGPEKVDCNSKDDKQVESVTVSATIPATSYALDRSVNLEKLPDDLNSEPVTVASLTESTKQFGVKNMPDINQHVPSVLAFGDTLQKMESRENPKIEISRDEEHSKLLVQDSGINESHENPKIETSRVEEHSKLLVQDTGIHNMPDINQRVPSAPYVVDLPNPLPKKESRKNPKSRSSRNKEHLKRLVQNSVINDMPDTTKIQDSRNKEHSKLLVQDSASQNVPGAKQHVSSVFDFADSSLVDLPGPLPKKESYKSPKTESFTSKEHSKLSVQDSGIRNLPDTSQHTSSVSSFADASLVDLLGPLQNKENRETPKIQDSRSREHSKLSVQESGSRNMPDSSQHASSVFNFADASLVDLPSPLSKKESQKTLKIRSSRNKEQSNLSVQDSGIRNMPDSSRHASSVVTFADTSLVDLPSPLPKKESPKRQSSRNQEHSNLLVKDLGIHTIPDSSQHASSVFSFSDASLVDLPSSFQKSKSHENSKIQDSRSNAHLKPRVQDSGIHNTADAIQHTPVFTVADSSLMDLPSPLQKKKSHENPKVQDSRNMEHSKLLVQDSRNHNMPDSSQHASSVFSLANAPLVDLPSPLRKKKSRETLKIRDSRDKEHSKLPVQDSGIHNMSDTKQPVPSAFNFSDASLVNLPSPLPRKESHKIPKVKSSKNKEHSKLPVQDSGIHNTSDTKQHAPSVFDFTDASLVDLRSPLPKKDSHKNPKVQSSKNKEHSKLSAQDSGIHNVSDAKQHAPSVFDFTDASLVDLPSPLPKKESHKNPKVQSSKNKEHLKLSAQDSGIHNVSDTKQHAPSVFNFTDASLVDLPSPLPKKESYKNPKVQSSKNKEHSKLSAQDSGIRNMSDTKQHAPSVFNFTDASLVDLPGPLPKKASHENPKVQSSKSKEHSKLPVQDSGIPNMSDTKQHVPSVFNFTDASLVDLPSPLPKKESHKNPKAQSSKDKEHSKLSVQDSGIRNKPDSNQHVSSVFSFADTSLLDLPSPFPKKESPKTQSFRPKEHSKSPVQDSGIEHMPDGNQHVPSVFSFVDASLVDLPSPLQKKRTHENHSRDREYSKFFQDSVIQNMPDINQHVSSVFTVADAALVDLAGPVQRRESHENSKIEHSGNREQSKPLFQDSGNPPNWSTTLSLVIGGTHLPEAGDEWGRYPPAVDHQTATTSSSIDQMTHLPSWHGLGETIEFSTLAEESVSDLLAEVDAMESRNGVPSPTSRRNSFLEDLFNGSIDDFSPTTEQGTRSDGFSSNADLHLNRQPAGFQFSFGLETRPVCAVSIPQTSIPVSIPQTSIPDNTGFKWADMGGSELHPPRQDLIDLNDSTRAEADEGERETVFEKKSTTHPLVMAGGSRAGRESKEREGRGIKVDIPGSRTVHDFPEVEEEEEEGEFVQPDEAPPPPPPPPPPLPLPPLLPTPPQPPILGYDRSERPSQGTSGRVHSHTSSSSRSGNVGWDSHHRRSGGDRDRDRYSNISNSISPRDRSRHSISPRDRSHHTEDPGHGRSSSKASWGRQSSFGSGSGSGGYSRPSSKGRVCKFYEIGRCRKGSACAYLHPQNR